MLKNLFFVAKALCGLHFAADGKAPSQDVHEAVDSDSDDDDGTEGNAPTAPTVNLVSDVMVLLEMYVTGGPVWTGVPVPPNGVSVPIRVAALQRSTI